VDVRLPVKTNFSAKYQNPILNTTGSASNQNIDANKMLVRTQNVIHEN
jgi:hypothetical protein